MRIMQSDVNDEELKMYSEDIKKLVKQMLEKNSSLRPTAKEVLAHSMFSQKILLVFKILFFKMLI